MKLSVKGFITHKGAEMYSDCADNYAVNINNHKFSVSDGVSKSFFPKIWSRILVENYVKQGIWDDKSFTDECQLEWQMEIEEIVKKPETKWFTRAEYNRRSPALATFVGLQLFDKEKKWTAYSLGDSFLFFVPQEFKDFNNDLVKLSSKPEPIVFDNFPDYLSSIGNSHKGSPERMRGQLLQPGTFYLMTDAMAEWFIRNKENAPGKIAVWQRQKDFEIFVEDARHEGEMSDDDSAILIIKLEEDGRDEITYIEENVTDLKSLIQEEIIEKEEELIKKAEDAEVNAAAAAHEIPVKDDWLNNPVKDESVEGPQEWQEGADSEPEVKADVKQDEKEQVKEIKPPVRSALTGGFTRVPKMTRFIVIGGIEIKVSGYPKGGNGRNAQYRAKSAKEVASKFNKNALSDKDNDNKDDKNKINDIYKKF
jgi:hypothetical protein